MSAPGCSSSIAFSLQQKGKSVLLKISYDSVGDKRLAQRAWQQLQADGEEHGDSHAPSHAPTAVAGDVPGEPMPLHVIAAALQRIKPPEWHKNGATLRLADGEPNAAQLLAAIAHALKSCVDRLREDAAEGDAEAAAAPPLEERITQLPPPQPAAPQPAAPQPAAPQPALEQERAQPVTNARAVTHAPPSRSSDQRALEASAALPPGVTLRQQGAWE